MIIENNKIGGEDQPVKVLTSSVTKEKMEAIVNVSKAIYELSKAINSTNLTATITNCNINTKHSPGIQILSE